MAGGRLEHILTYVVWGSGNGSNSKDNDCNKANMR